MAQEYLLTAEGIKELEQELKTILKLEVADIKKDSDLPKLF